jgi:hypothetical protein
MLRAIFVGGVSVLAAFVLPLTAWAGTARPRAVQQGYASLGSAPTVPPRSGGELPFTGIDLGLVVAGGAGLLLLGRALKRVHERA